ncbi:DUF1414 domain-containing protein [Pseudidiomarina mangrovi]|uniref:DUF1414 domain-containing protein n=1 Tax=Pseudidiomarina mangrovi TaxID=2487133 RepID=UPI000FCA55CE|nr:DUF1414 domain-containing protein [Pseudidiomarina mangrovi]CAI8160119.1 MAG: Uncharacterised protein [Pseudidiomarina mangrovi]
MPIVSQYDAKRQQQLLEQVMELLEREQVSRDLALMTLGNAVSNVIYQQYSPEQGYKVAEQFGKVLLQSLTKHA